LQGAKKLLVELNKIEENNCDILPSDTDEIEEINEIQVENSNGKRKNANFENNSKKRRKLKFED